MKADLLTPTNSALPFLCSSVSTASSSNAEGNSPGNANYGISFWHGVGTVSPYSGLGPIGNELGTLSDANVFEQRYVGASPATFAVGASDAIGAQVISVTCDTGSIEVHTPALASVTTNMRLYVAKDGSTYHTRADHTYTPWPNGPDLSVTQALRPEHLAQASPTYQADCYNTAQVTYSDWACGGDTTRTRTKTVSGKTYNATTLACDTDASPTVTTETEPCGTGLVCGTGGTCAVPQLTPGSDGLIGYWKFDGNGNNEVVGSPSAVAVGNALFNTSGGKLGGYAYVPSASDLLRIPYNNVFDLQNFTIEFWFRQRANQSSNQSLIYKGNPPNNYNFNIFRYLWNQYNTGPVIAGSTTASTGYWHQVSNPNEPLHNTWHHVAYAKTPEAAAYYIDGVKIHSRNYAQENSPEYAGNVKTPAVDIIVGDTAVDTDFDNLRIYNRPLTDAEVRTNGGFPALVVAPVTTGSSTPVTPATVTPTAITTGSSTTTTSTLSTGSASGTSTSTATATSTSTSTTTVTTGSSTTAPLAPIIIPHVTSIGTGAYATGAQIVQPSNLFIPSVLSPTPEASTAIKRTLTAAEETLLSFETFLAGLDTSKARAQTLKRAYELIDQADFTMNQIDRSVSEGNLSAANRRLGLLHQVMDDIKRTWELLARGQNADLPTDTFFNSETILKAELSSHGLDQLSEQITKIIIEKINFADIVSQVVKQSSETLNQLLSHSTKHEMAVSDTMDVLVVVDEKFHEEYLGKKAEMLGTVDRFEEKLALFETQKTLKSGLIERIDALKEKIISYNFIGTTGETMTTELEALIDRFSDPRLSTGALELEIAALSESTDTVIAEAREEKYARGAIPFKDTDDNEWFTQYVVPIQKESIISGYKDENGNSLGQFGPANNVTVAEILKIALEAAGLGQADASEIRSGALSGHWAAGYVTKGKELKLTLLNGIFREDQLNRSATRAEVVRVLLEVFALNIDPNQATEFTDAQGHPAEAYIEAARELDIIAGYDDGTFRPDSSVNRAETAKIVNLVMTSL